MVKPPTASGKDISDKMKLNFTVNQLNITAFYDDRDIEDVFLPLLRHFTEMRKAVSHRLIIFMAAPPGTGKSTLACFLQYLSEKEDGLIPLQAIGIDGFMYPISQLEGQTVLVDGKQMPMAIYKGCPESFRVRLLKEKLQSLTEKDTLWPYYDRSVNDSYDDFLQVTGEIVLVEGNYLLYDDPQWIQLQKYCDYSIFLNAEPKVLETRLIERKQQGGSSHREAVEHYLVSDRRNVEAVLSYRLKADLELSFDPDGKIINKPAII